MSTLVDSDILDRINGARTHPGISAGLVQMTWDWNRGHFSMCTCLYLCSCVLAKHYQSQLKHCFILNSTIDVHKYALASCLRCDDIKYAAVPTAEGLDCVLLSSGVHTCRYDSGECSSKYTSPDFMDLKLRNGQYFSWDWWRFTSTQVKTSMYIEKQLIIVTPSLRCEGSL